MASVSPVTKHKLVILGDESVGKTSILTRFMYDKFDPIYQATIGIDFLSKSLYRNDITVRLQLWDTAGRENFRNLIPSYIRDSSVAVIVYDVTNRLSFLNILKWIEEVRADRGSDVIIVLVGNKTDLVDKRQVSTEEGDSKARELGTMFVESSAKNGFNIKLVFLSIASNLLVKYYGPPDNNLSGTNRSDLGDHRQQSPQEYLHTIPIQMLPHQPPKQDCLQPQQPQLDSGKSLEEIVKNLAITQQQYQQDTRVSLKNLEKTIGKLVASVDKLEAKEWFRSQSETVVNPKAK